MRGDDGAHLGEAVLDVDGAHVLDEELGVALPENFLARACPRASYSGGSSMTSGDLFQCPSSGSGSDSATIPGLSIVADWIDGDTEQELLTAVDTSPWRDDLARRVQHYGYRYDYKARSVDASMRLGPLPSWGEALAHRIVREGFDERTPDQLIVNEYQPGQGIARHIDCVPCFGPVVLSLTLGSGCVMDLYAPEGSTRVAVTLAPRSLLVLRGEARSRWAHGIAARKSDPGDNARVLRGRRVSLTFRTVRVAPAP